ncbi:hypothetical protein SAMN04487926_12920 [Paraburkholderia steynii]|uniref:DUF5343 domain-containing protein n=1 Tax=Paraburkholderia steynii TaxID=1245441 RepID=A0A7Z7BE54_9BURK|nr:DUF5343 domain-containing protein [Paraburkholderia steynii]SDI98585.1 hypothetical protein SAMN04487926_12920 [Paraburkholderia steynii]
MADKHPYISGSSNLAQTVTHLRRSFPASVTADTLKKLGIAPNNETYVLGILRFLGIIDHENKKNPAVASTFNQHDDADFQTGFEKLVHDAYHEIFDLHGPDAWDLSLDKLVSFFRNHDNTSDIVGKRQAATFQALARLSGKLPEVANQNTVPKASRATSATKKKTAKPPKARETATVPLRQNSVAPPTVQHTGHGAQPNNGGAIALTVRVEINLPSGEDQETYDRIFKSIRENLLNGNGT